MNMTTATTSNTAARLIAAHKAFRAGKIERARRLAAKCGISAIGRTAASTWEVVVQRLTGSIYGYVDADMMAGLPNQVTQAPSVTGNILPRY